EGLLGFSQVLLLKGARSLLLSLWPVDDTATSLLMVRFYENWLGTRPGLERPLPKAEALQEAKAGLRGLTAREAEVAAGGPPAVRGGVRKLPAPPAGTEAHPFAHPYFWSAFILLGDPD